jgi:hypothetical protein
LKFQHSEAAHDISPRNGKQTRSTHVSGILTLLAEHGETLRPLLWVAVISSLVFGFLRLRQGLAMTAAPRAVLAPTAAPSTLTPAIQIERLFAFVDDATRSAERAMVAHAAAARHLDSAEYQLLRLFEEFPVLAAARRQPAATAEIVRIASPGAPRAMAA